jgi:uncharacterized Fe-S center protein
MEENSASIDEKTCIGCGECLTVCRYGAVKFNWETSSVDIQKRIAEHALGAVKNKEGKTAFFNFLINVTKDCDCYGKAQKPVADDIGILASVDPVAIDQATIDVFKQHAGKSIVDLSYPSIDETVQLIHGEKIGLGQREYNLIQI